MYYRVNIHNSHVSLFFFFSFLTYMYVLRTHTNTHTRTFLFDNEHLFWSTPYTFWTIYVDFSLSRYFFYLYFVNNTKNNIVIITYICLIQVTYVVASQLTKSKWCMFRMFLFFLITIIYYKVCMHIVLNLIIITIIETVGNFSSLFFLSHNFRKINLSFVGFPRDKMPGIHIYLCVSTNFTTCQINLPGWFTCLVQIMWVFFLFIIIYP